MALVGSYDGTVVGRYCGRRDVGAPVPAFSVSGSRVVSRISVVGISVLGCDVVGSGGGIAAVCGAAVGNAVGTGAVLDVMRI